MRSLESMRASTRVCWATRSRRLEKLAVKFYREKRKRRNVHRDTAEWGRLNSGDFVECGSGAGVVENKRFGRARFVFSRK